MSLDHVVGGGSGRVRSKGRHPHVMALLKDGIGAGVLVDVLDRVLEFLKSTAHGDNAVMLECKDVLNCFETFSLRCLSGLIRLVQVLRV